jgi:mycothiol synthase
MTTTSFPTTPLSERISAPRTLEIPVTPGIDWRAPGPEDGDAMFACETAIGAADHPHYVTPREEFDSEFEHSYVDAATDCIAGFDSAGTCVAYGLTFAPPGRETLVRAILMGGVSPARRGQGIGRQLLAWQEGRGLQQLATSDAVLPGWLLMGAEEKAQASVSLYVHAGFSIARYFLQLTRDLSASYPEPTALPDLTIVPFSAETSERVRVAKNNSFRDHWGSQSTNQELWESGIALPTFRGDLSRVAVAADGTVAGFALVSTNEDDWDAAGYSSAYVDLVGVTREYRGRGIAPALLGGVIAAAAVAGLERAVLDVDSANPSGALGLYQGLGFVEESRSMNFVKEF